jgi:Kef-type K+ transport system membrane component KefB
MKRTGGTTETMQSEYPLLITLGALLILGPLVKSLMERLGVPALIGYIGLGFLVSVVNQKTAFVTPAFDQTFSVLAQLGVVALLFRVGLKSHTEALLKKLPDASLLWIGDVVTNLAFGFIISRYALGWPLDTSLVIATAFSATSVAVSVAVWDELHLLGTPRGQLLLDVAELDDLSGVILLALLLAIIPLLLDGGTAILPPLGMTALSVVVKLALFVAGCYLFSYFVEPGFTRFNSRWEKSVVGLTITVLGSGLAIAGIAEFLGFSLAIGALFAGLAFSRDPEAVHTDAGFAYFYELLTPFFFIYIGMQVDPGVIASSLGLAAILFVPAALGKFLGVTTPALLIMKKREAALLGLSMVPRAEIAMVIVFQCRQLGGGLVSDEVFSAMVLLSVMTSIFAPLVLRRLLAAQQER